MRTSGSYIAILSLSAACSKAADSAPQPAPTPAPAPAVKPVACDATAIEALATALEKANGLNIARGDKAVEAEIAAAKAAFTGKAFAFTGCTFARQGNDEITFSASGTTAELGCIMKDGDAGVAAFRDQAMALDLKKLRLDVRGEIAPAGMLGWVQMTSCVITAHE